MALKYPVSTCLELYGASPWADLREDVEIVAHTDIREIIDLGIDFYELWFKEKNIDSLYSDYVSANIGIYMAKKIQKDPYQIIKKDPESKKDEDFIYLFEGLFDESRTRVLTKRINLLGQIDLGNFYAENYNSQLVKNIVDDVLKASGWYSLSTHMKDTSTKTILVPKTTADFEDNQVIQNHKNAEEAKRKEQEAAAARESALIERENRVKTKEDYLGTVERDLQRTKDELEASKLVMKQLLEDLIHQQEELDVRSEELAEREYRISVKEKRIYDRENELGLPHTL